MKKTFRSGFSLIELIIVIALIAIIAAAVFVAIDPARRINAARNSTRWADTTAILEAVKKYQADNEGSFPATAVALDNDAATSQLIGGSVGTCGGTASCAVLPTSELATTNCGITGFSTDLRPYLKSLPFDGKTGTGGNTRYYINKDAYGILTVGACDAEGENGGGAGPAPVIEVTR